MSFGERQGTSWTYSLWRKPRENPRRQTARQMNPAAIISLLHGYAWCMYVCIKWDCVPLGGIPLHRLQNIKLYGRPLPHCDYLIESSVTWWDISSVFTVALLLQSSISAASPFLLLLLQTSQPCFSSPFSLGLMHSLSWGFNSSLMIGSNPLRTHTWTFLQYAPFRWIKLSRGSAAQECYCLLFFHLDLSFLHLYVRHLDDSIVRRWVGTTGMGELSL